MSYTNSNVKWGKRLGTPIFDSKINIVNPEDISAYKINDNCENDNCLVYMYNKGHTIYSEINKYNNVNQNIYRQKVAQLFKGDFQTNSLKKNLLNDNYLTNLQNNVELELNKPITKNYIINHILDIIKPYIIYNKEDIDFESLKEDIFNTIIFKLRYMNDYQNQLRFLLGNETIQYIKDQVIGNTKKNPQNDFIKKILKNEINRHTNRKVSTNKITTDNIDDIYLNQVSVLTEKDVFSIITNCIAHISSILLTEENVITNNEKLDRWDTILGEHNKHGIRQHGQIKVNDNKPPGMLFNMNY